MSTIESLPHYIERFFALRQHQGDAVFVQRLAQLRRFQDARLRLTHNDLLVDATLSPALHFILDDIYDASDLLPVAEDIRRAEPLASKLLPAKVMNTAAHALAAAVITQELDEALTALLAEQLDAPITAAAYAEGYRQLGRQADRQQQITLIESLGAKLEKYLRRRLLLRTFKMVRKPVHKAGFGHLYDFMSTCFDVMRPVPDAAQLLAQISHRETVIMQGLFAGDASLLHSRHTPLNTGDMP